MSGVVAGIVHNQRRVRSDSQDLPLLPGEVPQLLVRVQLRVVVVVKGLPAPGGKLAETNGPFPDGFLPVKHPLLVQLDSYTQSGAVRAHPMGMVHGVGHGTSGTGPSHPGKQQAQQRSSVHRCPNRGAGIGTDGLLVHHHAGGQIPDILHRWPLMPGQSIPQVQRIGRLPLPSALLCNGVKGQRALS